MPTIEFSLIKTEPITFKVSGVRGDDEPKSEGLPAYLAIDMNVTLVSGKWPLYDYQDCGKHLFVFQKADGSQFTMVVGGFAYDCTKPIERQPELLGLGHNIHIEVEELTDTKENDATGMTHPEFE